MLTKERYDGYIESVRQKIANLTQADIDELTDSTKIDFEMWFEFNQLQAQYHAAGVLDTDTAQAIYHAVGETYNGHNGGWADGVTIDAKLTITKLMSELMAAKVGRLQKAVSEG